MKKDPKSRQKIVLVYLLTYIATTGELKVHSYKQWIQGHKGRHGRQSQF